MDHKDRSLLHFSLTLLTLIAAGKPLPFLERIVLKLEKESIPRWNKFLQVYFDASGISSNSFDQVVTLSAEGGAEITDYIKDKDITLMTSVRPALYKTPHKKYYQPDFLK